MKKGFTLIERLVTLVIIGILTSVVGSMNDAKNRIGESGGTEQTFNHN